MSILIEAIVEYNDDGYLIYSSNHIGAFVRGKTKAEALAKFENEIFQYTTWLSGENMPEDKRADIHVIQEKKSSLQISDADSDVIFNQERLPLKRDEYNRLKTIAIKSAEDFNVLYKSIPNKNQPIIDPRKTFYGTIPHTANEIYKHTNGVTSYYVGEIGVLMDNLPDIARNRMHALKSAELLPDFLNNHVYHGSYDEEWSLRKVLRRFIWHDRIHAKAIYKNAVKIWGEEKLGNPFYFELQP